MMQHVEDTSVREAIVRRETTYSSKMQTILPAESHKATAVSRPLLQYLSSPWPRT